MIAGITTANKSPMIATKSFGQGRSVYLSGHQFTPENVRLLHRAVFYAARAEELYETYSCSNVYTECAYYPNHRKMVVINNSNRAQDTWVTLEEGKTLETSLEPYSSRIIDM